jgi:hypothetical protein
MAPSDCHATFPFRHKWKLIEMNNSHNVVPADVGKTTVASYKDHVDADAAVRLLVANGVPVGSISIIGKNFKTQDEVHGFYRPQGAALMGARNGAWFGGFFALAVGTGFFVFPAIGALTVLGPLSELIAVAAAGAGAGALLSGLVAVGLSEEMAVEYEKRLKSGEFLVIVQGSAIDTARAHQILGHSELTRIQGRGEETLPVDLNQSA